tara:strand:+ start:425 stop:583 length:159 start_codon:yes stop_codon:yes gene_type:complete
MKKFLKKFCCCFIKKKKIGLDAIYFPTQEELYDENEQARFLPSISLSEIYVQ